MQSWTRKRVLIVVRTYPVPSAKSVEASCTAAITEDGRWLRLFPVPYRLMDQEKRFRKWQWIEVDLIKAGDARPESYKINPDSITACEHIGTQDHWHHRREIIRPMRARSMCWLQQQRDQNQFPTLGVIRPFQIKRLIIKEAEERDWTAEQQAICSRIRFSKKRQRKCSKKFRWNFDMSFGVATWIATVTQCCVPTGKWVRPIAVGVPSTEKVGKRPLERGFFSWGLFTST